MDYQCLVGYFGKYLILIFKINWTRFTPKCLFLRRQLYTCILFICTLNNRQILLDIDFCNFRH